MPSVSFVFYLFVCFWLCWVFRCCMLIFLWLRQVRAPLLLSVQASLCSGFSCCRAWAVECGLSMCGPRAEVLHVACGISWTRNQTHVPCIGRQILQHWTSRKVPLISQSRSALHLLNPSPLLLQDFSHLFPPPSIPLVPRILSSNLGCHFLQAAFLTPKSYSACHQDPKIASQLSS